MIKEISIEDIAARFNIDITDNDILNVFMNFGNNKLVIEVNEE